MPALNTAEAGDTASATGILLAAGTVTDGGGTETSIGIDLTDADIVTALSVGDNPITGGTWNLNATTALTLGDALTGTDAATVAIFSSDWEISTTGAMAGIGAITSDGLISTSGGLTVSAGDIALTDNTGTTWSITNAGSEVY